MILALFLLFTAPSAAGDEVSDDYRSYVDQARFFMKKDWFGDAEEQLELAIGTDDGELDPETWFLLASVRYQLTELAEAREAADRALVNSRTEEQTRQAKEFLSFLDQQFGIVELQSPRTGTTTKLNITLESVIFDPQLKEYFNKLNDRLGDNVTLPYPLGLPAGTYTINGEQVEVAAGSSSSHDVAILARGPTGLQLVEVDVSAGILALFGDPAPDSIPAPQFELGVNQPIGIWVLGGTATWTVHPIQQLAGIVVAPTGWSAGGKFGVETQGDAQIALRPSLTARYGAVPGIELGCDPGAVLTCVPRIGDTNPLRIAYTTGHAAMIGGEVDVVYRDRRRESGLGVGLKTAIDGLFGRVPASGESLTVGGAAAQSFEIDDNERAWSALGLRVHFGISYAL